VHSTPSVSWLRARMGQQQTLRLQSQQAAALARACHFSLKCSRPCPQDGGHPLMCCISCSAQLCAGAGAGAGARSAEGAEEGEANLQQGPAFCGQQSASSCPSSTPCFCLYTVVPQGPMTTLVVPLLLLPGGLLCCWHTL
jgi:hypothetical protein